MLWCTAIYTNSSCEPSARLSNPGSASSVWAGLTNAASSSSSKAAKPRNNYTPRFVFYRKKRTLFTKKRFFSHKNENAQHWGRHIEHQDQDPDRGWVSGRHKYGT